MEDSNLDINDKELAILVRKWLRTKGSGINVWNQNKFGIMLKEELLRLGHWKHRSRGKKQRKGIYPQNFINPD